MTIASPDHRHHGAPNFTTRLGVQHISHLPPDELALRNAAQIRADPRAKFKDSYGMHHPGSPSFPDRKHGPPGSSAGGAETKMQVEQLQMELAQARSEILQLRTALHYAGLSLQGVGSWEKLPQELRGHLEAHHRMVDTLTGTLQERDAEILRLSRQNLQKGKIVDRYRHTLLQTVGNWSESGALLLAWSIWKGQMRARNREADLDRAIKKVKADFKPQAVRNFQALDLVAEKSLLRYVLAFWMSTARELKLESSRAAHQKDLREATLAKWAVGFANTALHVCWVKWRDRLREKAEEKEAEARRVSQLESAKQLKRESIMNTTMAMISANEEQKGPWTCRLVLTAWRRHVIDIIAQKTLDDQRKAANDQKERMHAKVIRHALLILSESEQSHVAWIFATWKEYILSIKQERHVEELKQRQAVFHAWYTITKNGQRKRELKKAKSELEEVEAQHQALVHKTQMKRHSLVTWAQDMGEENAKALFLKMVWSAWIESIAETQRTEQMEHEKELWKKEFEKLQQENQKTERARNIAMALSVCSRNEAEQDHILMAVAWSALVQTRDERRREKQMFSAQRVYEDELQQAVQDKQKAIDEAAKLEKERQEMDERLQAVDSKHRDKSIIRNMLFLTGLADRDKLLTLHAIWSAWRECVMYGKEEVKMMEDKLRKSNLHDIQGIKESLAKELHDALDEDYDDASCCRRCLGCRCMKSRHSPKVHKEVAKHSEREKHPDPDAPKPSCCQRVCSMLHCFWSRRKKGRRSPQVQPEVDLPASHEAKAQDVRVDPSNSSQSWSTEATNALLETAAELTALEGKAESIAQRAQQGGDHGLDPVEARMQLAQIEEAAQRVKVEKVNPVRPFGDGGANAGLVMAEKEKQLHRIDRLSERLEYVFQALEDPKPPVPPPLTLPKRRVTIMSPAVSEDSAPAVSEDSASD